MSISIHAGEWRKIRPEESLDDDIFMDQLGSGLGIFVYDPESRIAFGGRFAAPDAGNCAGLLRLLDQSMTDFRDSPLVRIYVSGCAEQDHESWDTTGALTHRLVEVELKRRHRQNQRRDLRWPRQKVLYSEMSLFPCNGEYECGFRW